MNTRLAIAGLSLALLFFSCDNLVVSRAEYEALLMEKQQIEAENDSLQFELSDLKMYNDYLETTLDSVTKARENR